MKGNAGAIPKMGMEGEKREGGLKQHGLLPAQIPCKSDEIRIRAATPLAARRPEMFRPRFSHIDLRRQRL